MGLFTQQLMNSCAGVSLNIHSFIYFVYTVTTFIVKLFIKASNKEQKSKTERQSVVVVCFCFFFVFLGVVSVCLFVFVGLKKKKKTFYLPLASFDQRAKLTE